MNQKVLWVIREKHTDHVFPTLKSARASTAGFDDWVHTSTSIRIISRIVVYKFKKGSHVRST